MQPDTPWRTEFVGRNGGLYPGPIVLASCQELAEAICADCLLGPNGHTLRVTGPLDDDTNPEDDYMEAMMTWGHA